MKLKYTPDRITELHDGQIFCYGANRAGRHGAGAAKLALQKFGAQYGKVGLVGQSYGLCTKDENIRTLPLHEIKAEIKEFMQIAENNPQWDFLMTEIGCGLANYSASDIAPLFCNFNRPINVFFPKSFEDYWAENGFGYFNVKNYGEDHAD
jgi:hypothetical protein